ncbi:MAG: hypothetical protein Q8M31_03585 [Beijerinckiaceae bacterium]|nr:hypothetical protein [Beijerinckiaceae bacterium]
MSIPNHPKLADLIHMPVSDLVAMPAESLALLQDEADEALRFAKLTKDWIDGALAVKYGDAANAARQAAGKDTGIIRFHDGAVTVIVDLPKRVDWDQDKLAAVVERIRADGADPADYVDVSFSVSERKYTAWHTDIRQEVEHARTVRTGKPKFRLALGEEAL